MDSRFKKALLEQLAEDERHVFTARQLASAINSAARSVDVRELPRPTAITKALVSEGRLQEVRLKREDGSGSSAGASARPMRRYVWGKYSPLAAGLSMRPGAYLSHGTAVELHGLTERLPRTIYVNKEQSPKPSPVNLTQEGINRAFRAQPRRSQNIWTDGEHRFVLLNGKSTNRLEVALLPGPDATLLDATKLERTLIDIAVRPAYAGGPGEVLEAYRAAESRVSVNTLAATLVKLGHVYPYHQAIGWYLQRAGVPISRLNRLKEMGLQYDFFLAHAMPDPVYSEEWRLWFPRYL